MRIGANLHPLKENRGRVFGDTTARSDRSKRAWALEDYAEPLIEIT